MTYPHPDAITAINRDSLETAYRHLYADAVSLRSIAADRVSTDRETTERPSPINWADWPMTP